MHTAESIKAMNNATARKICEAMATDLMGTDRFQTALSDHIGSNRVTVAKWFSEDGRPPVLAILYLQAEIERREAQGKLDGLRTALERL